MNKDKGKTILIIILIIFTTLLVRGLLVYYSNYTADDSFITFRYAENIACGKGFVYNEGERVLGTTTPLYTLLLALLVKLGLPIVSVARIINIGADCLTGILIFLLLRKFKLGVATFAGIFYVLFPRVIVWSVSGMETSLYVLFIAASLYFYHKENFNLTFLFLGLIFLTRVDGVILGLAILVDFVLRYKKFPTKIVLGSFGVVLPWLIFSFIYFGSPLPNSVMDKKALYGGSIWETPKWRIFWEFLFLKTKIGWPLLALSLAGVYRVLTKAKSYTIIVIWTFLYFSFFFFSETKIHMWYYVPFYLGYLILVALGLDFVSEKAEGIWKNRLDLSRHKIGISLNLKIFRTILLSIVFILAGLIYFQQMKRTFRAVTAEQIALEGIHKEIGLWLLENTQPDDTVCAEDIGYMGYYSGRYILDQDGLVSPQAISFIKDRNHLGLLKRYKPAYFLSGFYGPYFSQAIRSKWFKKNYEKRATFNTYSVKPNRAKVSLEDLDFHVCEYNIYKRIYSTD
jgi:arabinofuranosyltransferase